MAESSEQRLKWRELLSGICGDLLDKNVDKMKFICGAELPDGSLERCTDGLKLVKLLIENAKISEQDCSYLIRLLDRCGRTDLSQRLHDEMPKTRDSVDQVSSAVLLHSQSSPGVSSGSASADTKLTLPHSSSLGSARDFEQFSVSEYGGRQGQSCDMTEGKVVKELWKQRIECLFTSPFLQNTLSSVKGNRTRLSDDLKNEEYARRYPLMNLLGYLNSKAGDGQQAEDMFNNILKEKPDNLLALLNLMFFCEHLGLCDEARRHEQQIIRILDSDNRSVSMARAKYELAEILTAVDAHKQVGGENNIKCLFEEALRCDGIEDHEKREWEFGFAFFYFKVDSLKGKTCEEYFVKSMKHFYNIVMVTPPSREEADKSLSRINQRLNDMISKAWCFMGNILSRWERNKHYKVLSDVPELECLADHARLTLTDCLLKAKETWLEQNMAVISRRIGVAFLKVNTTYAKEYLLKALKIKKDGYGCVLMGRYNLQMYKADKEEEKYLDEAIKYFSDAEEIGCDLWHCYRDYAECLFHKGKCVDALAKCKKSETNGGSHDSALFSLWAQILEKRGDQEGAKKKRSRAERVKSGDVSEKYTFGWLYCDEDATKIGHITQRLEALKDCNFTILFVRRDMVGGDQERLEPWEKINEKCQWILVYCSHAFNKSEGLAKQTLPAIIANRNKAGNLKTVVPVVEQGIQVPHLILENNKTLKADDPELYEELKRLVASE